MIKNEIKNLFLQKLQLEEDNLKKELQEQISFLKRVEKELLENEEKLNNSTKYTKLTADLFKNLKEYQLQLFKNETELKSLIEKIHNNIKTKQEDLINFYKQKKIKLNYLARLEKEFLFNKNKTEEQNLNDIYVHILKNINNFLE